MNLEAGLDRIFAAPTAAPGSDGRKAPKQDGDAQVDKHTPVIIRMSDVKPKPLQWLWPGRIPLGKLTLLIGDPGLGKSLVTLDIASRVSTGTSWPDATSVENPSGAVVLLSAEDDIQDTIVPRFMAAGANRENIVALQAVRHRYDDGGDDDVAPFSLATDIAVLKKTIEDVGDVRLVIIDPISAYLGGKTDSHKDADVRRVLSPLADLAARHRVSILAVSHLNKRQGVSVMYRADGELGFPGCGSGRLGHLQGQG